jgi:hypothetical protein
MPEPIKAPTSPPVKPPAPAPANAAANGPATIKPTPGNKTLVPIAATPAIIAPSVPPIAEPVPAPSSALLPRAESLAISSSVYHVLRV